MSKNIYFSEKDMEDRLRTIEETISYIEKREDRHFFLTTFPVDLWLESSLEEGGIIIIHSDYNVRSTIANSLKEFGI